MQVIPVVDLMGGVVVRAHAGRRDAYRPIETPLSRTPDPVDIVSGLMGLAPFPILYVADLDAIRRQGDNYKALSRLREKFPGVAFWIDNGAADDAAVELLRPFGVPVLGSESQQDLSLLSRTPDAVLSLDFRGERFLGPSETLRQSETWPERIIVMSLERVGAGAGLALERMASIRAHAHERRIYAAGGLRDARDLVRLRDVGAAGVLVATALHDGRLGASDLI